MVKYKLKSADDGQALCAFFSRAGGCKNGANCKFIHSEAAPKRQQNAETTPISSESSDDEVSVPSPSPEPEPEPAGTPFKNKKRKQVKEEEARGSKKRKNDAGKGLFASMGDEEYEAPPCKWNDPPVPQKDMKTDSDSEPESGEEVSSESEGEIVAMKKKKKSPKQKQKESAANDLSRVVKSLNLPIAPFAPLKSKEEQRAASPTTSADEEEPAPLRDEQHLLDQLKLTPEGKKWHKAILATQSHPKYRQHYTFKKITAQNNGPTDWVETKAHGDWCKDLPAAIAFDCEMCETRDPVSGAIDAKALCRFSVIDATDPQHRVLIDTLVKPDWPITQSRANIHGISKAQLKPVQVTLRHAQAFMLAMCSDQTVMIGHALHYDLTALKLKHKINVDTAYLFHIDGDESKSATPSLKDTAATILGNHMVNHHDSVADATTALRCALHYQKHDGIVPTITPSAKDDTDCLFVHRIPKKSCTETHLREMFLAHTHVLPKDIPSIEFYSQSNDSKNATGKTKVQFSSRKHAALAFDSLSGTAEPDKSNRLQKKVFLKKGGYIRVRQMGRAKHS